MEPTEEIPGTEPQPADDPGIREASEVEDDLLEQREASSVELTDEDADEDDEA